MSRQPRAALLLMLVAAAPALAADQECPPAGAAWVALDSAGADGPPLSSRFVSLLRAQLADRAVAVCVSVADPGAATARVALAAAGTDAVTIEIRDRATDKLVRREVALAAVPPVARELALAIAIDGLLGASWAELAIGARKPPADTQVAQVVPPPVEPRPPRAAGLGIRLGGETYGGGQTHLGMDARVLLAAGARWGFDA